MTRLTQQSTNAIRAYKAWDAGIPPVSGGYLDQTKNFHEALHIIAYEFGKWEEAKMESLRGK